MKPITIWSTVNKDGKIKHNHIQDDWILNSHPSPTKREFTNQKAWKNLKWKREYGYR